MSVYDRIPHNAAEAHAMLGERAALSLDTATRLHREPGAGITMTYLWSPIVRWAPAGDMLVYPGACTRTGLRRIAAALPDEWRIDFRPRRRARFIYRDAYTIELTTLVFRADGGIQWGMRNVNSEDILTREVLDRGVSDIQGFSPLASRRRRARPRPEPANFPPVTQFRPRRRVTHEAPAHRHATAANASLYEAVYGVGYRSPTYTLRQDAWQPVPPDDAVWVAPDTIPDLEAVCLCGETYGRHLGWNCPDGAETCWEQDVRPGADALNQRAREWLQAWEPLLTRVSAAGAPTFDFEVDIDPEQEGPVG